MSAVNAGAALVRSSPRGIGQSLREKRQKTLSLGWQLALLNAFSIKGIASAD
ncbi:MULTISPECIES: hypothetical protein [unclassified Nodularia (in: cyanobacteria)]|uniref:hypothetical protein n=1 Tax=unclassified Nodularia (in: cyanobacteria) TaxID=2656917 RepID=UPI00187E41EE|nr:MULTISPECIES: hypothetical protein [unclassified Nodularia (in: cyanobacteria)]MBE9198105.1 hypothetical protein [Nodularia sp. LEGE 06071]MCC2693204.1 hypothetical protein [Nodularia sp. LEGE 04288]